MDTKLLRHFIEIVDCGGISAAAKKLFVSQPALSAQLKQLEEACGTPLLVRTSRSQRLTDAGRLLYERALHILYLERSLKQELSACGNGTAGTLRLALTPSTATTMLDGLILDFSRAYPNIRYELFETDSFEGLHLLESGVVDAAVVRTPCSLSPAMDTRFLPSEAISAVYRKDVFPIPGTAPLGIKQLEGLPLCVIRRYEQLVTDACLQAGFVPTILCTGFQLSVSIIWAESGLGVALVPFSPAGCADNPALCCRPVDEPSFSTKRAVVTMREGAPSSPAQLFLTFCGPHFE